MLATDLALVAAIVLLVTGCAAYVALRVRRVAREARAREDRRAGALLAEVTAARAVGARGFEARSARTSADGEGGVAGFPADGEGGVAGFPADGAPGTEHTRLVAAAHDLAAELRRTAERVVATAADVSVPVADRSEAIVRGVLEVASPSSLRRVTDRST